MWKTPWQRTRLDWLQIEVSSVCTNACMYCPQTAYESCWENRFLAPEQIDAILPHLHPKTYIHLQGWGEPFAHPQLVSIIKNLKDKGFKVGTTTSGTMLDDDTMEALVDMGLDLIAFSTAGCSGEENDPIRQGTSLEQVIRCINTIQKYKAERHTAFPRVHIAQMLLRSNLIHLDTYPAFWKKLKVDQVVLSSLSLVTRPELQKEACLADTMQEWDDLKRKLYDMRANAGLQNVLRFHLVSPFMLFNHCTENIAKSAVIASDGTVAPCVMSSLPVTGQVRHWAHGRSAPKESLHWGTMQEVNFRDIWKQKPYSAFRRQKERLEGPCRTCLKRSVETMETAYQIVPESMTCRWQIIQEANAERDAIRRMEKAMKP
ncbi:radical SAM/SPASM domain-containing protein [Desulfoluna butyratoxydans]|uniref:Radical sam n=1 Tax=Desulfoluna butyratoxydans TaxID=231438 RepID=A0A4U8YQV4_9BACT|nr:radical SAM protein [Desulfoluna butyratoxydans]VFQ44162.1 radical sam [Desulfoluna butyratoxydans]